MRTSGVEYISFIYDVSQRPLLGQHSFTLGPAALVTTQPGQFNYNSRGFT